MQFLVVHTRNIKKVNFQFYDSYDIAFLYAFRIWESLSLLRKIFTDVILVLQFETNENGMVIPESVVLRKIYI